MASQSSYIKRRPSLLQPSARLPSPWRCSRGHARPRARSPVLHPPAFNSLFLSDACILSPNPTRRFFGKISSFRAFDFPLSLIRVLPSAALASVSRSEQLQKTQAGSNIVSNFCTINIFIMSSMEPRDASGASCWITPAHIMTRLLVTFAVGQVTHASSTHTMKSSYSDE